MIYVFAVCGFILGFAGGLAIVNMFLKSFSTRELVKDKSLHWTYGLAVWVFGGLGAWAGVWFYHRSIF